MMLSVIRLSITNRVRNTKQYCRIPILVELNCKLVIVVLKFRGDKEHFDTYVCYS